MESHTSIIMYVSDYENFMEGSLIDLYLVIISENL